MGLLHLPSCSLLSGYGGGLKRFGWSSSLLMCFSCFQIAPAEGMDAKQRMVIIVGPPEAQFKVLKLHVHLFKIKI